MKERDFALAGGSAKTRPNANVTSDCLLVRQHRKMSSDCDVELNVGERKKEEDTV